PAAAYVDLARLARGRDGVPPRRGDRGLARYRRRARAGDGRAHRLVLRRMEGDHRGPGEGGAIHVVRQRAGDPGPEHLVRDRPRPDRAGGVRRPGVTRDAADRSDAVMTLDLTVVCPVEAI